MTEVILTDAAVAKINDILTEENNPSMKIRCFVQGGGCSGFQYGFTLDEEQNEDDFVITKNNVNLLIDAMSMQYLVGATIDYQDEFLSSQFVVRNPNAQSTCGCGSSFSV